MFYILFLIIIKFSLNSSQTIKHLNEISINEELPIETLVTSLTDKIPNLDQSIEYDLVTPLSDDLDVFSINHNSHSLVIKNRIDYEYICLKQHHYIISVSIAVSNEKTIDVYILPIRIININDNPIKFLVNRTVIEIEENDENWSKKSYALPRAYDDDDDVGDLITYSIYLQNWNKPSGLFEFDEKNLRLKPLKKFDREEQNIYLLRLIAHNQDDASTDIIILIKDLNDNSPICQQNQTVFLIKNISTISILLLNVTDLDEGDNGKLEYQLINSIPGFSIDRYNGQIKFDYKQWIRSNESLLIINVTDHGKFYRLSTKCFIEIKFTFLFEIYFQLNNHKMINETEINFEIENFNYSLGQFKIYDKQINTTCFDCLINMKSSLKDIFYLDDSTYDLYLNLNSIILMKILTNYYYLNENLTLNLQIDITNIKNPSIKSTKNFVFILHFNKLNILTSTNIYFLKIHENMILNEQISIYNRYHHCLNDQRKNFILIDITDTFEIDQKFNLILKKFLNKKQQNIYHLTLQQKSNNSTNEVNLCSIQLQIYVVDPYTIDNTYPYFSQSFYILSSKTISEFFLPSIPSYVKYKSSVPNLISINPFNGSIIIRSSTLYSSYYYDFKIEALDSQTPSLSSFVFIRIFFGTNKYSPRLSINSTRQRLEILSSNFLYQIKAYDPDILLNDQMNLYPPSIEYEIDSLSINNNIEIERYTGRIFLKNLNITKINFTLIMKDFGQPNRLITQHKLIFDIKSKENFSISFFILCSLIVLIIILLSILLLIINCCCTTHKKSLKSHEKPLWKNISPTAPDTRLIDNEYITTTISSLPRLTNREQRIYSTNDRKNLSHLSLDKLSIKHDYQQRLSMSDINKYLERFEKIYHDSSSSQQYLHQPLGSVV